MNQQFKGSLALLVLTAVTAIGGLLIAFAAFLPNIQVLAYHSQTK